MVPCIFGNREEKLFWFGFFTVVTSSVGSYLLWTFSALVFASDMWNVKNVPDWWVCFILNFRAMVVVELFRRKSNRTNVSLHRLLPFLGTEAIKLPHCQHGSLRVCAVFHFVNSVTGVWKIVLWYRHMGTINLGSMESVYGKHLYLNKNEIKADWVLPMFWFPSLIFHLNRPQKSFTCISKHLYS